MARLYIVCSTASNFHTDTSKTYKGKFQKWKLGNFFEKFSRLRIKLQIIVFSSIMSVFIEIVNRLYSYTTNKEEMLIQSPEK